MEIQCYKILAKLTGFFQFEIRFSSMGSYPLGTRTYMLDVLHSAQYNMEFQYITACGVRCTKIRKEFILACWDEMQWQLAFAKRNMNLHKKNHCIRLNLKNTDSCVTLFEWFHFILIELWHLSFIQPISLWSQTCEIKHMRLRLCTVHIPIFIDIYVRVCTCVCGCAR